MYENICICMCVHVCVREGGGERDCYSVYVLFLSVYTFENIFMLSYLYIYKHDFVCFTVCLYAYIRKSLFATHFINACVYVRFVFCMLFFFFEREREGERERYHML